MGDPVRRARLGAAARALVDANRGAKDKTLERHRRAAAARRPARRRPSVPSGPLSVLSAVYGGSHVCGAPGINSVRTRGAGSIVPVISVGNLVVGGSGKTPVVAALARLLRDMGERPAILSRGYAAGGATTAWSSSATERVLVPVERSGDEPQMLARALAGSPVLVCAGSLSGRPARRAALRLHGVDPRRRVSASAAGADDRPAARVACGSRRASPAVRPAARSRSMRRAPPMRCSCHGTSDEAARGRRVRWASPRRSVWTTTFGALRPLGEGEAPVPAGCARGGRGRHRAAGAFLRALFARRAGMSSPSCVFAIITGSRRSDLARDRTTSRRTARARAVVTTEKDAVASRRRTAWWAALPMHDRDRAGATEFAAWLRGRTRAVAPSGAAARHAGEISSRAVGGARRPRVRARAADVRRCAPAAARSAASCTSWTAFIAASRSTTWPRASPTRSAAERARDRAARCSRTSAALLLELIKFGTLSESQMLRRTRNRGRRARAPGVSAGPRRAVLHRTLRLLGDAGDRARAARASRCRCWRGRSTTRICTTCSSASARARATR